MACHEQPPLATEPGLLQELVRPFRLMTIRAGTVAPRRERGRGMSPRGAGTGSSCTVAAMGDLVGGHLET